MSDILQNSSEQEKAGPVYTYTFEDSQESPLEHLLFRLFEKISNENLNASS